MVIEKIKQKKKWADIDFIHNQQSQTETANTDKISIKEFLAKLVAQKMILKKQTRQG